MISFPGGLTAKTFLSRHWQKAPLFIAGGIEPMRPSMSRNELAWLATLQDVESRLVFTERDNGQTRYRAESGPFDTAFLQALPGRDWSLLVHDVDKHLPAMRRLFAQVPFVPDWRIDDLMISFAAPGGGVGPHRDNYDVFLCQGIGIREWRYTEQPVDEDPSASDDLALLREFDHGETRLASKGDVLYLPPGIAHWGTARRACITYSIGMRAPSFYADPDLALSEVRPGYISAEAKRRAGTRAKRLGTEVTDLKPWLRPDVPGKAEIARILGAALPLRLHGMARIAYDDGAVYVNGAARPLAESERQSVATLCARRRLDRTAAAEMAEPILRWLLARGAFALPEPD